MSKLLGFTNFHGHSTYSVKDALGSPREIVDAMMKAGMNAGAISDHGNMNGMSDFYLYGKEKKFKTIYAQEFYFIPSLNDWRDLSRQHQEEKERIKAEGKKVKKEDEDSSFKEDEEETKSTKKRNPLKYYNHLVLIAQSPEGLKNLYRLTYHAHHPNNFYYVPRIDFDLLNQYGKDLVCFTACVGGPFAYESYRQDKDANTVKQRLDELYGKFHNIFGEKLFLELQFNALPIQHIANRELIECAKRNGGRLVATADYHYPNKECWKEREMLKALAFNRETYTQTEEELKCLLYPKNAQQMLDEAQKYCKGQDYYNEDLIIDSINMAKLVDDELIQNFEPDTKTKLSLIVDYGAPAEKALSSLINKGLKRLFESEYWKKNNFDRKKYIDRAKYEYEVIKKMGQVEYFLNIYEIINLASEHMLVGPGRGSGAGSLVCYLLGITKLDPIYFGLIFERFVNEGRKELPDIDTDFEDVSMVDVLLREKFGDIVYPISTYMTLKLKSVIKDVCKMNNVDYSEVNLVTKKMEAEAMPGIRKDMEESEEAFNKSLVELDWDSVHKHSKSLQSLAAKYPWLERSVKNLFGAIRQPGQHAGGIVISKNIWDEMPVQNVKGQLQTSFTEGVANKNLPKMGFVKVDRLGLNTLRMQKKCLDLIEERHGIKARDMWARIQPEYIDFHDQKVYQTVFHNKKNMTAVFQFTEAGARSFCEKAKPTTVEEIAALTAIYRPGPLAMDVDKLYTNTKALFLDPHMTEDELKQTLKKQKNILYDHPILTDILKETYGFMVFQEQMMFVGNKLGKLNLVETDKLRKLIVKKDKSSIGKAGGELHVLFEKYEKGCMENGISKQQAKEIWDTMEAFSGYGFNKSHALAYGIVSFQCAWLRTYYPLEWLAAVLSSDDSPEIISEVRGQGFRIELPDVNVSRKSWTIDDSFGGFVVGLQSVKGLGEAAIDIILEKRPFNSVKDFLIRCNVNKKAAGSLAKCDALRNLDKGRFETWKEVFWVIDNFKSKIKDEKSFEKILGSEEVPEEFKREWTDRESHANKLEIVGFFNKEAMMEKYRPILKEFDIEAIDGEDEDGPKPRVWGFVQKVEELTTKKAGKKYLMVTCTGDTDREISFRIWNEGKINTFTNKKTGETKTWESKFKEGEVLVFGLNWDQDWGYSLDRSVDVLRIG